MIQIGSRATPICFAIACPSSIWNPGGSPPRLEKGKAFGCAHCPIAPCARMMSSDRAWADEAIDTAASSGAAITSPVMSGSRLQRADIGDEIEDLLAGERAAERRHPAHFSV